MKANEAPEKIYVHKTAYLGLLTASKINITGNDVEYTRTDAFINKACEWLKNFNDYHNIMRYRDCSEVPLNELIDDFKNYMEE